MRWPSPAPKAPSTSAFDGRLHDPRTRGCANAGRGTNHLAGHAGALLEQVHELRSADRRVLLGEERLRAAASSQRPQAALAVLGGEVGQGGQAPGTAPDDLE